ncbi:unnamed protein product [Cuscuta campestris]|uniref:CCHC-type domain-containing protein n=1 Tax=Cuscuta campestris TaxID=132261 RepID=A0A484MML2_9ASTE|nr:unnamed protein product [Cuscuta campestris]
MEIRFKHEEEVLEFYKNGKVSTIQSKKNPQRTIQVIESTVRGAKVKISQMKLKKKLHLPNSGIDIGKLSSKNLDWKTIEMSGQIPSGPAKKADLKNDYKLVLELVIACLECGSGGHADDITQERAFIINALITRTKVNWAKHFFNSVSKHLGKPKQKYLCQGLYLGHILESLGVAFEGKKYDARYWLYYLSTKGENRASSTTEDEGSSDNVLIVSLKKSSKRKQVVSSSPSAEEAHTLVVVNLDEEEELSAQGELQKKKKKKRRISSPSTSGNANPDNLVQNEPNEEVSPKDHCPQQLDVETCVGTRVYAYVVLSRVRFMTGIGEGHSTTRPPLFDGTNYTYWKERMRIYIRSTNFQLWLVIKNGEEVPMKKIEDKLIPKTEDEFDAEDIKKVENYAKEINILYCAVNPNDYRKISCCSTAKEMWDKLEVTYEGTDQVREAKIDFLTQEYEMFRMKDHEKIDKMFDRFSKIVNDLHALKKTYTDRDLVRKILRSLTSEWRSKANAIYESIGTSNVTIYGLRGNLKTYESTILNPSLNDQRKGISLKAVKESTMNDSSDDDEVKLVMKKFCKLLRKKEKVEDGPVCYGCGEAGHIKNKCPRSERSARHFKKQKAYISWGGDSGDESTDQEEDEAANLCLMAHKDQTDDVQEGRAATSGKSKSKSRAPSTNSEERLYCGDGSYLWFDSEEERTRFLTFFSKRVVAPPRIILEHYPELQGYDDLDAQLHQAGLWPFISRARKEINPALIRAFYSSLRREDDMLYSLVKSTPIELTVEHLGRIAGLPFQGEDVSHYGGEDWVLNNEGNILNELGITELIRHASGRPTIHSANLEGRLVLYIVSRIIKPRKHGHIIMSGEDLKLIHAIMHSAPINWAKFVMINMTIAASTDHDHLLPYPFVVMDILERFKVITTVGPLTKAVGTHFARGQRKRSRTGKNVGSSSAPPPPPAHKYLDGSFLWFNDREEAARFLEKFEHREILPPRFSTARFIHDSIPREARVILEGGNFLDLLYIKKAHYHPFLVRAFYSNLKKDEDGALISNVNGVDIYLNEENIQILTGLRRDGQDLGLYVREEGARFNETALLEEATKLWTISAQTFTKRSDNAAPATAAPRRTATAAGPAEPQARANLASIADSLNRLHFKVDGMDGYLERLDEAVQRQGYAMNAYFQRVNYVPPPYHGMFFGQVYGDEDEDDASYAPSSSPDEDEFDDAIDGDEMDLYYVWRAWKVGNSVDQLLEWDQQLENEKIIKRCLGLPINCFSGNQTENQAENIIAEAQTDMEAAAEDFQVFPETSPAFDTVLPDAKSTPPEDTEEEAQEEPVVEALRSFEEAEEGAQIARLEATETPVAIFEQQPEDAERDSLSRDISNYGNEETEEESLKTLRIDEEEAEQGEDVESLPLQLYQRVPSSNQVTNFHSSSTSTFPDEMPESWTKKIQGLIQSALESQKASFRQELDTIEERHNQTLKKTEEKFSSNLKEISQSLDKTLEIISLFNNSVSNSMMAYASDCHLQLKQAMEIKQQIASITTSLQKKMSLLQMDIRSAMAVTSANQVVTQDYLEVLADNQKEAFKLFRHFRTFTAKHKLEVIVQPKSLPPIPKLPIEAKLGELAYIPTHLNMTKLILEAHKSNLENLIQHLSNTEFDGTEVLGTIASHFTNDVQTKERYKQSQAHQGRMWSYARHW